MESAILMPSSTMSNVVSAIAYKRLHREKKIIVGDSSHIALRSS